MTFDPVTGDYNGLLVSVEDDGVTLHLDPAGDGAATNASLGGAASIVAGKGAGDYRRVIAMPNSHTVVIDKPFSTTLDGTSRIQLGPFKGKFIFYSNSYIDGGTFQTYGNAMDVVVAKHTFERSEGLLSWGRSSGTGHNYALETCEFSFSKTP